MDVKARKSRFRKYTLMFFIVSILLMVVSGVLGGKNANDIYGENAESTYSDDEFYIDTKDGNKLKQAKKSDKEWIASEIILILPETIPATIFVAIISAFEVIESPAANFFSAFISIIYATPLLSKS